LGSALREIVEAYFVSVPAGIDVLLELGSGLNEVDFAKKKARIKAQDFVFQVQAHQPKKLKDTWN
jgi:hypothetical protein